MEKNRWWLAIPFALGVMVVNVLISILYVVVYSYVIDPGHDPEYYQAYAQVAAPYSSIVAGILLMFLAGRWIGGKFPKGNSVKAALMDYRDIITIEPRKRSGKPCIRGMRITVQDILEYLAGGMTEEEILSDFPELTLDDIGACVALQQNR